MKKTTLRGYARLIARKGLNVQKGQDVRIMAELDQPEFVKMTVEECYRAGARKVSVEWSHQPLTGLGVKWQDEETLGKFEDWEIEKYKHEAETLPCRLYLESADPDGLAGLDQNKFMKAQQAKRLAVKRWRDEIENKHQWCIAAVPGIAWAKKMFPGEPRGKAMEKLWEAILFTSRADSDPVKAWDEHNADLAARCDHLNSLGIKTLEYKSSNGTDLRVGLIEDALFLAGMDRTLAGVEFNPNIPSEEVYITPMKGEAEGVVYSTKPLSFQGQLIDNFHIRFEKGRAVEVRAEKNEELLRLLIEMDEGAAYLGECALVPKASPISESGLLFWNTLFDENASCHLALGLGFPNCIRGYEKLTLEECRAKGVNDSVLHEDFMIGAPDLDIFAKTRDGKTVQIFKDGNWAF